MRKIILGLAVSLDGFIEGPNGEFDWCFTDQDYGMSMFLKKVDAIFYGRKSYELMLRESPESLGQWADKKHYVFSTTYKKADDKFILVDGDIPARVEEIKRSSGKDIWLFGGASLTSALMAHGLVDQLWLSVHPILLGSGRPLFENLQSRVQLKLVNSTSYETGLVSLKYEILNSNI